MTSSRSSSKSTTPSTSTTSDDEAVAIPALDEALERGHLGPSTDERPNEDYTVEGAIKRKDELTKGDTTKDDKTSS